MFINNQTHQLDYEIESTDEGLKVIDVLATRMNLSSRLIRKAKSKKKILLNGLSGSVNRVVKAKDIITLLLEHEPNTFEANEMPIDILYEDFDIIVVNKSPFLVVHPTKGHPYGTLVNGLSDLQHRKGENYKIRLINRLDRDTSGVILIAKNGYAQQMISDQMVAGQVKKYYYALVKGEVIKDKGTIDAPIGRIQEGDIERTVTSTGQHAITHYEVVKRYQGATFLKLELETGRTHQIRVHLKYIGHPIVGDSLYGEQTEQMNRQALHCYEMQFKLPRRLETLSIKAPLPEDIEVALNFYEKI